MRPAAVALGLCALALPAATASARVTDATVVNRYDTRFDLGMASPSGIAGGAVTLNFPRFVAEGAIGWGPTGAQLSAMPKLVLNRWGKNTLMLGVAATFSYPLIWRYLGTRWSFWQTAELAWQRVVHIDRILYIGVGVTRGTMYEDRNCGVGPCGGQNVVWPEVRIGWGLRR